MKVILYVKANEFGYSVYRNQERVSPFYNSFDAAKIAMDLLKEKDSLEYVFTTFDKFAV